MTLRWVYSKPAGTSNQSWRRQQIARYLELSPDCTPKDVFSQVSSHSPNPWPSCSKNNIGKIMRRMRMTCSSNKGLVLCIVTLEDNFEPPSFRWEIEKPRNVDIHCWRRTQLTRYVNKYPSHKPKKILDQLEKHSPNPWPECNTKKLSRLINIVKKTRTLATCGSVKISSSSHLLVRTLNIFHLFLNEIHFFNLDFLKNFTNLSSVFRIGKRSEHYVFIFRAFFKQVHGLKI